MMQWLCNKDSRSDRMRFNASGKIAPSVDRTERANGLAHVRNRATVSVESAGKRVIRIEKKGPRSAQARQ